MIDFNLSNLSTGWLSLAFNPYVQLLGAMAFGIPLLAIGGHIYLSSNKNALSTSIYYFVTSFIFGGITGIWIVMIMLLIAGLYFVSILYGGLVERRI